MQEIAKRFFIILSLYLASLIGLKYISSRCQMFHWGLMIHPTIRKVKHVFYSGYLGTSWLFNSLIMHQGKNTALHWPLFSIWVRVYTQRPCSSSWVKISSTFKLSYLDYKERTPVTLKYWKLLESRNDALWCLQAYVVRT